MIVMRGGSGLCERPTGQMAFLYLSGTCLWTPGELGCWAGGDLVVGPRGRRVDSGTGT